MSSRIRRAWLSSGAWLLWAAVSSTTLSTTCADRNSPSSPATDSAGGEAGAPGVTVSAGGSAAFAGAAAADACDFRVHVELSPLIGTVASVEWSLALTDLTTARIEFGPGTDYRYSAPVDLAAPNYRTLLLGMRADTEHHFRISAESPTTRCVSGDYRLVTAPLPNGASLPELETPLPAQVAPGFLVTARYAGSSSATGTRSQLTIYNERGDLVWWYTPPFDAVSRARLSYDGKFMIARNVNVRGNAGRIVKVSMDGTSEELIDIPKGHHDFAVTPDHGLVLIQKTEDTCDEIVKLTKDGRLEVVFEVLSAFAPDLPVHDGELCHTNSIHYNDEDSTYTLSELRQNVYIKITSTGELVWVLGGNYSDFTGAAATWQRQHGHHQLAEDRWLFFNNGELDDAAWVRELRLDLTAMTAEPTWSYASGLATQTFGDVQRLPNGNTLVTYSNAGVTHEVDAQGRLVQAQSWPLGGAIGYANHRPTLYGAPPR